MFVLCTNKHFKMTDCRKRISVEETSCNQKQEPLILRSPTRCSLIGVDGRTDRLDKLVRVSIGWQLHESNFFEQIGLCVDESSYGTVWTNHTLHGESIAYRDIDLSRPGFRVDTTRSKRLENLDHMYSSILFYQRFFSWSSTSKMNDLYKKKNQRRVVTALLDGVTKIDGETIIETNSKAKDYFAKGHLAPDANFVYEVLQDATYYFINALLVKAH